MNTATTFTLNHNKTSLPSISLLFLDHLPSGFLLSDFSNSYLTCRGIKLFPTVSKGVIFHIYCLCTVNLQAFGQYPTVIPTLRTSKHLDTSITTAWCISNIKSTRNSLLWPSDHPFYDPGSASAQYLVDYGWSRTLLMVVAFHYAPYI